jgi:uncharacterized cofD-like protein
MELRDRKKIVILGGGTGAYTALLGLKKHPLDLSVIVTMMDSGGSNRVLRDEFGLLPTSDIRQCIVALTSEDTDDVLRKLFTYRYSRGTGIEGMTFGNLFMAALTDIYGSQEKAIEVTKKFLSVCGDIIPVTYDNTNLVARYANGNQVVGEHYIDEPKDENAKYKIVELEVFPQAKANPKALTAIKEADLIILGPGDLYTSILSNIVVDGVSGAIVKSKAKKAYIVNLMTRYGQTDGFSASDHLNEIENYLGRGVIDYCLVNKRTNYPQSIVRRYRQEGAYPVKDDLKEKKGLRIVRGDFVSNKVYEKARGDRLVRSLIRHDPDKLAKALVSLLK